MPTLTALAHAKLNLTLDVLGRRSDGYHDLRMVMTSVALADVITLETGTGDGVRASANLGFLPTGEKNLAASALLRLAERRMDGESSYELVQADALTMTAGTYRRRPRPQDEGGALT